MEINYKIEEADFLEYQLYTASKSERISKKKRNGWLFLIIGSVVLAIYFYLLGNMWPSAYCLFLLVVFGLFYPKYFAWRYKKHYQSFIKDTYQNMIGESVRLEFSEEFIFYVDRTGEGKTTLTEIEVINEIKNHFFIRAKTAMSIIIPKQELEDENALRSEFETLGLTINNDVDWVWK